MELAARQGEGVAEHTKRTVKGLVVIVVAWMHGKLFLDCGGDRKSKGPLPSRAHDRKALNTLRAFIYSCATQSNSQHFFNKCYNTMLFVDWIDFSKDRISDRSRDRPRMTHAQKAKVRQVAKRMPLHGRWWQC